MEAFLFVHGAEGGINTSYLILHYNCDVASFHSSETTLRECHLALLGGGFRAFFGWYFRLCPSGLLSHGFHTRTVPGT